LSRTCGQVAVAALAFVALAAGCGEDSPERAERQERRAEVREERREERREAGEREAARPSRPPGVPADAKRRRVTGVVDGDTVRLAGLDSSRLIGVDTPEIFFGAKCFGAEASAFTKQLLPVGTVVYFARGVEPVDDYARDLVYVWLPDGTFVNALLAKRGYAVPLTIAPNDRFADLFDRLAEAAKAAGRGLWARRTCEGDLDRPAG